MIIILCVATPNPVIEHMKEVFGEVKHQICAPFKKLKKKIQHWNDLRIERKYDKYMESMVRLGHVQKVPLHQYKDEHGEW